MLTLSVPILLAARPVEGRGWIGHWSPGIGDPTMAGWITVVLYLLAAWICLQAARRSRAVDTRAPPGAWEPRLWTVFAVVLVALGIDKQLDLQTAFTESMRGLAREQGWSRDPVPIGRRARARVIAHARLDCVQFGAAGLAAASYRASVR